MTAGLVALVYGITAARQDGWGSAAALGTLAASAVLLAAFAAVERRSPAPLASPAVLARPAVKWGNLGGLTLFSMSSAVVYLMTLYLQDILGFGTMTLGYGGYGSRVHDPGTARLMFDAFAAAGYRNVDTAHGYGNGSCEQMLGDLDVAKDFLVATRFESLSTPHGHDPDVLKHSVRTSLERLRAGSVAILYLAYRDSHTPLEDTLRAVDELHREGIFGELGLNNFSAADMQAVLGICAANRWVRPTVYQGLYNAVSRRAEDELLSALAEAGIRFHAYNPLAGGAFAPGFESRQAEPGSRWDPDLPQGRLYRSLYLNPAYLAALGAMRQACAQAGVPPISAALRWLVHHSSLRGEAGDGVILGASSPAHLTHNLAAVAEGPLPAAVVAAIDDAAQIARPSWPEISRTI